MNSMFIKLFNEKISDVFVDAFAFDKPTPFILKAIRSQRVGRWVSWVSGGVVGGWWWVVVGGGARAGG